MQLLRIHVMKFSCHEYLPWWEGVGEVEMPSELEVEGRGC